MYGNGQCDGYQRACNNDGIALAHHFLMLLITVMLETISNKLRKILSQRVIRIHSKNALEY